MQFSFKSYNNNLDVTRLEDITLIDVNSLLVNKAQAISYGPGHCNYRACYAPRNKFASLEEALVYAQAMNFAENYRLAPNPEFYEQVYAFEKLSEQKCHEWINGLIEGFHQFTAPEEHSFEAFTTKVNLPGFERGYRLNLPTTGELIAIVLAHHFVIFSYTSL